MNRDSLKVFLACFIGAGIGSLVALQISHAFWWVGLISGPFVGYINYEFRTVLRAIPQAYAAVRGWRPRRGALRLTLQGAAVGCAASQWMCIVAFVIVALDSWSSVVKDIWAFPAFLLLMPCLFALIEFLQACGDRNENEFTPEMLKRTFRRTVLCSVPVVIFWHLPRGLYAAIILLPTAARLSVRGGRTAIRFFVRFSWELFLRIHSEKRLICGTDSLIGAGIGYFAGNALIGALAGGLIGLLNYAFVTKRWLEPAGHLPLRS